MKIGDLVGLLDEPDVGYGLVIGYDKPFEAFEVEFADESGNSYSYLCSADDDGISIVSRAPKIKLDLY